MKFAFFAMSLRLYSALLSLYPAEFRKSFGGEMLWLFECQLTASRRWGITRAWWLACRDFISVALPGHLQNERVVAFAISAPATIAIYGFLIRMLQDHAFARWISHKFLFGGC